METITCSKCHEVKPATTEFFGHNPERTFRKKCRACRNAYNRNFHKVNPELGKARAENYNKRKQAAIGSHTDTDIAKIRIRLKDKCFYCGDALNNGGQADHIVPLLNNGTNLASNMTLACDCCNPNKGPKSVREFVEYRKELNLKISEVCIDYLTKIPLSIGTV